MINSLSGSGPTDRNENENRNHPLPGGSLPVTYEVCVEGHLSPASSDWFDGLTITNLADGVTLISGPVQDQAALHGLLARVRDLNLKLISVRQAQNG